MKQLYVIGMGPGGADQLIPQARYALEASQVLCGYTTYLDLAREFQDGREIVSTPMTQELERCRLALERAAEGKTTAMICSGDAGVYGMAGPILQMAEDFPEGGIEVIPGVTAALAVMSMLLIYGAQFRYNGLAGGLKRFGQPSPVMVPINLMEIIIRPLALCMRLFGNVLGAYIIMEIIKYLVPAVVPAVFSIYFDLFDGIIQTVVFVFLTAMFAGEGIKDEE